MQICTELTSRTAQPWLQQFREIHAMHHQTHMPLAHLQNSKDRGMIHSPNRSTSLGRLSNRPGVAMNLERLWTLVSRPHHSAPLHTIPTRRHRPTRSIRQAYSHLLYFRHQAQMLMFPRHLTVPVLINLRLLSPLRQMGPICRALQWSNTHHL